MKKRYILLLLFSLVLVGASAQTLEQAKAFYNKGQYEKAKPVFKKFVRTQPANGNYNLWYGVCCLETGEPDVALKYQAYIKQIFRNKGIKEEPTYQRYTEEYIW